MRETVRRVPAGFAGFATLLVLLALLWTGSWTGFSAQPALAQGSFQLSKPHPDLPEDFRQLLPRGRIAAVDSPQFVPAAEAEIPGDAWILGVVDKGQAKAYSLNLLNHHEVVNDEIGGRPIAAVW